MSGSDGGTCYTWDYFGFTFFFFSLDDVQNIILIARSMSGIVYFISYVFLIIFPVLQFA